MRYLHLAKALLLFIIIVVDDKITIDGYNKCTRYFIISSLIDEKVTNRIDFVSIVNQNGLFLFYVNIAREAYLCAYFVLRSANYHY